MLSDADIIKKLGAEIFIYPFEERNIKGASINLTASNMAWSSKTKNTVIQDNTIHIAPHDTVLIMTNELVHISANISGTLHSKLSNICLGLGHDASTLNPGWFGRLVIPIHNYTDEEKKLLVGETFITMLLYYLNSKTNKVIDENPTNRTDLLVGYKLSRDEKNLIFENDLQTLDRLKKRIQDEKVYDDIKNSKKIKFNQKMTVQIALLLLLTTALVIMTLIPFEIDLSAFTTICTIGITALVTTILADVNR